MNDTQAPAELYLELLKKTLSFALWEEPPIAIDKLIYTRSGLVQKLYGLVASTLRAGHLHLVKDRDFTREEREYGRIWPGYAHTMIGRKRLDNLHHCIRTVVEEKIEGDLIETGVWRGGACIFMQGALKAYGETHRQVFVADSFEGLPKPDADKYPTDKDDLLYTHEFLAISQQQVEENFRKFDLLGPNVRFLKGWFKDSLPGAPVAKLAVLRLDGDMYESTMDALNALYHKLSPGGFCIVDDYVLENCKQAVADFRQRHGITATIQEIDWTGVYWRK